MTLLEPMQGFQECTHERRELRVRVIEIKGKKTVHFKEQCLRCGTGKPLKREDIAAMGVNMAELPQWDDGLQDRYNREVGDFYRAQQRAKRDAWWRDYEAYLRSDAWRARRTLALTRDGGECQARMRGCGGKATQAHHTSYRHLGNEPLWELQSVCESCHEAITAMDRQREEGDA